MISRETACRIWDCYNEIDAAERLLADLQASLESDREGAHAGKIEDAFGRRRQLWVGVPSGEDSSTLFGLSVELAQQMIRSHIEVKRAELIEANELARREQMDVVVDPTDK